MASFMELTTSLHEFCVDATAEREVSHGWQHMDHVRRNSLQIWETEKLQYSDNQYDLDHMTRLIIAVAQLHDVADHKYGKTVEQLESVRTELSKHFSTEDVGLIQAIIDNVSYSKEAKQRKRGEPPSWVELGAVGRIVRNICSDADKMEAIGMIGVQRCLQYSAEVLRKKISDAHTSISNNNASASDEKGLSGQGISAPTPVSAEVLITQLIEHGHEKLFILLDDYVVTKSGKALAKPRHDAMMVEVARLTDYLEQQREHVGGEEEGQELTAAQRGALESFEGGVLLLDVLAE